MSLTIGQKIMSNSPILSKVMIVDDDRGSALLLRTKMSGLFEVHSCASGEEALAALDSFKPDLVLMDVQMPGLNGYETCVQIRQGDPILPVIFVTANQSLEEHQKAYDAGGDDLVTKPVNTEILINKATLAIRHKSEKQRLTQEAQALRDMAMNFLSNSGESSILLGFVRKAVEARSYEALAQYLVDAASEFGVQCSVMLRHPEGQTMLTSHGEANHLERSILERMSGMGRLVEFKSQFIVNFDRVSVMIRTDKQDSQEKIGRIRDNTKTLAETAEALCENVSMRVQSMAHAEQMQIALMTASAAVDKLRENHQHMLLDTRILLQELVDNVESTYSWLGTTHGQEAAISGRMQESVQNVLALLTNESQFNEEISNVQQALRGKTSNEVDLF